MTVTDDIKQRLDIVALINESGVQLRKAGRNFTGFCPFHPNARTPAFYVFPDTQSYYCFSCHAAGDVFNFVMGRQGLDFGDALRQLAGRAGVHLEQRTPEREQEDATRVRLRQINEDAAIYWQHVLVSTQKGQIGRAYIERRGLTQATVEAWQLGYAPDDWSDLLRYLTDRKGYQPDELEAAGLVIKREQGGYYDRFRNRLMFPIRSLKGEIIGFGGRALGDDHAKYMNTPETPLFHKSSVLYGIDMAREAIRREDAVVVVEGYVDVLMAHQAGFANVVAPMGTALTAEQVGIVKKLTRSVYLALDADAAGTNATLKGLQTLRENMDSTVVPVPTPQGYIRWERELDGVIKIIALPPGRDPDEVIRANPDDWRALVAAAQPLMVYYLDQLTDDLDLRSAKGRADAVERLAPLIGALVNPVERAHYVQQLAQKLGLEERLIRDQVERVRRGRGVNRSNLEIGPTAASTSLSREDQLLSLLLRFPGVRSAVESELSKDISQFPEIVGDIQGSVEEPLVHIENQQIWQTWLRHAQPSTPDLTAWLDALDPYLKTHAQRLLTYQDTPELPVVNRQYHAAELATRIAQELRKTVVITRKNQLKAMYESVDDPEDQRTLESRLVALNKYQNLVTAPRRSTFYIDLGNRLDQLK
ncbi:MAG TPA: DNA primase [Herpetosiphonaceae bacterium]